MSKGSPVPERTARAFRASLAGLGLLSLGLSAAAAPDAGNLLHNPGFATGLEPWRAEAWGGTEFTHPVIDTTVFRGSDMASLRLAAETGRRTVIRQSGLPRNPAVTQFRFSVWTRTRDLAPGWILRVGVERWQAGRYVATMQNLHVLCTGTVDWTRTDIPFTPHDGTAEFAVYIGLWYPESLANSPPAGGGSVWIDDVTLEPVPAESATPTAAAAPPAAARLEVQSFHPLGEAGLFTPGQPLELELVLLNRGTAPLATQVTVSLAEIAGAPAGRCTLDATLPPGVSTRQPVRFDATKGRGFFCARAEIREAGDLLAWSATGRGGVRGHGSRACGHLRSRRGPAATGRLRLHIPSRWRRRGGALDHRRGALYGPGHTAGTGPGLRSHGP